MPWEQRPESLRRSDQQTTRPALKAERPTLAQGRSPAVQHVAVRIDLALQAFCRQVTAGAAEPGDPRFRGQGRSESIPFPPVPVGCRVEDQHRRVATVEHIKGLVHPPLGGHAQDGHHAPPPPHGEVVRLLRVGVCPAVAPAAC
jgi:putative transposase